MKTKLTIAEQVAARNAKLVDRPELMVDRKTKTPGADAKLSTINSRLSTRAKAHLRQEVAQAERAVALWQNLGLPRAVTQYKFHVERKWRFDFAFPAASQKEDGRSKMEAGKHLSHHSRCQYSPLASDANAEGKPLAAAALPSSTIHPLSSSPGRGGIAVEVQGAVFGTGPKCRVCGQRRAGRHSGGTALLAEHEKWRAAAELGWRILPVSPREVMGRKLAEQLKRILGRVEQQSNEVTKI